jgi:Ca-activated chloride channel family protein
MATGSAQYGGRHSAEAGDATERRFRPRWWIAGGAIVALLLVAGGYQWLASGAESGRCTGFPVTTTVAASPDQAGVMSTLAKRWNDRAPGVGGRCVRVAVVQAEPGAVATALGPSWDTAHDGRRPDVWAPDSRTWTVLAAARPDAKPLLPDDQPSIAASAVVLALPRPIAEAMGWPDRPVHLSNVLGALATAQKAAQLGKSGSDGVGFGMPDPSTSSAGLDMLLSILDRNADGKLSDDELSAGVAFASTVTALAPSPADPGGQAGGAPVVFPTDEHSLVNAKPGGPELIPVYPDKGVAFADHPYVVLKASWVGRAQAETARLFRDYLLSADGRRAYGKDGFRDPAGSTSDAPALTRGRGFDPDLHPAARQRDAASVGQIVAQWKLFQRPINILIALDTSGSMNDVVPQLGVTRLRLLQQAAVRGIGLLSTTSKMELWQFSSRLTPAADYQQLVPFGPMTEKIGSVERRQELVAAVEKLRAHGGTGLYDTADAAFHRMQQLWQPEAVNFVMLITDGKNEDDSGLNLGQLLDRLQRQARPDRATPILSIAVGPQADAAALSRISQATGGRTFIARNDADAIQQLVLAFAGRLR